MSAASVVSPAKAVCRIEGCGKPVRCRGWCRKHYVGWQKHGDPLKVIPRRGRGLGALSPGTIRVLEAAKEILSPDNPTTVRFVLYRLISLGVLESTAEYNRLCNILRDARIRGEIDDGCFVDHKRSVLESDTWSDINDFMASVRVAYRRNHWQDQPERALIFVEKGTVGDVVEPITKQYGVPLFVSAGYYSRTFLVRAAEMIEERLADGLQVSIGYIGDHDASGFDVERAAEFGNGKDGSLRREGLRHILDKRDVDHTYLEWTRLAVTHEDFLGLPAKARVAAKKTDRRYSEYVTKYGRYGAEVEALSQDVLQTRVEEFVTSHIDWNLWKESVAMENAEQDRLAELEF